MEEGIAARQRSTSVFIEVEFAEVDEQGIPDGEANCSISEWHVTAFLTFVVIKSIIQGILIRGKKPSQTLFDDNIIHLDAHDGSSGGGDRERVK